MKGKSSFITMALSVIAIVLYVTLFGAVMTAMETVRTYSNISTFTALLTVVQIAPTVLLLGGIFGASFGFYKGYQGASAQDASGIIRMVFGVILVILFVTLFGTILTAMYSLYSDASAGNYTAFTTVVQIAPTVLFLMGIFAGGVTAVSGARTWRRRRARRLG